MQIQEAIDHLRKGQLLLLPADIGWVIACDATHEAAASRMVALQPAGSKEPVTVLISEVGWLQQYVQKVPDLAWDLVEFAEKPLTVSYAKGKSVAPALLDTDGRLAVRFLPEGNAGHALVKRLGRGIATFPAGNADRVVAQSLDEVLASLREAAGGVYPGNPGENMKAKLPTLLRLEWDGEIKFLRK